MLGRIIYSISELLSRATNKIIIAPIKKDLMNTCGKKVTIGRRVRAMGWQNICVGEDVSIGQDSLFMCTRARVIIGNHIIFGPRVSIITGGHRMDVVGKYMSEVTNDEKRADDDQDIVFEGDNWIGADTVILRGVHIGKGSVVAAGAVVTNNVAPYSVVGGVPAKNIKYRFTKEVLEKHNSIMEERENVH